MLTIRFAENKGLCIPLHGNIPLGGNICYKWMKIEKINFKSILIQKDQTVLWISIETVFLKTILINANKIRLRVLINLCHQPFAYFTFTGINYQGMPHHICDVPYDENMYGPIRTPKWRTKID